MNHTDRKVIYVRLLEEGVDVFRPVYGYLLDDGRYEIDVSQPYDRDDEIWEFPPGSRVMVEDKILEGKPVPVAIA